MQAKDKLAKARAGLVLDMTFFGALVLKLKMVETDSVPTACTDGSEIQYNPKWVGSLTLDEVKGILAHEVMHCVLQHHLRRDQRDAFKWNMATDYVINLTLESAHLTLPKGALLDHQYRDQYAEQVYGQLPNYPSNKQAGGQGQGGQGQSGQNQQQGSGASSDPGGCGGVKDATDGNGKKPSPAKAKQMAQDWKVATAQAVAQAKAIGDLPGALERLVDEIVNPKVNWREALRRFVDSVARNDYMWFPPNRRYVHKGLYLPSVRSQELGTMVVVLDTSGSIGQHELDQFAAEMSAILEEYSAECEVIYCDAQVAKIEHYTSNDLPLELHPAGGGGTDFRPPFDYVEDNQIEPPCLIYFTDGQCRSYPEPPAYPTLWAVPGGNINNPFGEVLEI